MNSSLCSSSRPGDAPRWLQSSGVRSLSGAKRTRGPPQPLCLRSCEATELRDKVGTESPHPHPHLCFPSLSPATLPKSMGAFIKFICPQGHLLQIHSKALNRQEFVQGIKGYLIVFFSLLVFDFQLVIVCPWVLRATYTPQDTPPKRPHPWPLKLSRPRHSLECGPRTTYVRIIWKVVKNADFWALSRSPHSDSAFSHVLQGSTSLQCFLLTVLLLEHLLWWDADPGAWRP